MISKKLKMQRKRERKRERKTERKKEIDKKSINLMRTISAISQKILKGESLLIIKGSSAVLL